MASLDSAMHARQRFLIADMNYCIVRSSICNTILSSCRARGYTRRFLILLSNASHMCSMGLRSGLLDGHVILWASKWHTVVLVHIA